MKTINIFKALFAFALTATTLASCDSDVFNVNTDPFKGQKYKEELTQPISIYLESDPDFSEYVKALRYSETYNALNQSTSGVSFTSFAPNNEAMLDFYQRRGVSSLEDLTPEYVRSFVLYHTVKDSIPADQFVTKKSVINLPGETLDITIDAVNSGEAILASEGRIIEMGLDASNGKIYVLSKALTPLVETVYDRVVESGSTVMAAAIEAAGWTKDLSTVADTIIDHGVKTVIHRYYTLLNVTDATFARAGITSVADLRTKLSQRDERGLSTDSLLREYVGYHILNTTYSLSDFGDAEGEEVATKLIGTMANNQTMMIAIDPAAGDVAGKYTFNHLDEGAHINHLTSDVRATNGYMHEIDSWLPVWEPEQTEIIWDLADYAEVRSIVQNSDPELYQPAEAVSKETNIPVDKAACFTFEAGESGTANRSYTNICYTTTKSYKLMAPLTGQTSTAYNNDRMVFNLGYMGWVSMKTPTIVRGKYRVEISLGYLSTLSFIRTQGSGSNGGLIKVSFDENEGIFARPYPEVSTAYSIGGIAPVQLIEEIEFTETSNHDFKMIIMDPAASSNSGFSFQIDCIRFIPIK